MFQAIFKGAVTIVAAVSFIIGLETQAKALPGYEIVDLGTLGGEQSYGLAINNSGVVVGNSLTSGDDFSTRHAFVYRNGLMIDLGTLGGPTSNAFSINDRGQIVGQSLLDYSTPQPYSSDYRAFTYNNNDMSEIETPYGKWSRGEDINNYGQIAITATNDSGYGNALLYQDGSFTNLGTLGGETSVARAINNSGKIVGESTISSYGYGHAFFYEDGEIKDLGTLGGEGPSSGASSSIAFDINDSDQIVGWSFNEQGNIRSFLYEDNQMYDLGTLGGENSKAFGVNDFGQVVGTSQLSENDLYVAYTYINGKMNNLNDYIPVISDWDYFMEATDVNDQGQITGYGRINGEVHAFLMTPEWDALLSSGQNFVSDYLTLGETFTFDYWWEMGMEPTENNFDVLFFNGTEWETFGWVLNFDGSSSEWETASFWVPPWLRGHDVQIKFSLFDWGQETDPTVYLRNIGSAPVPEPATIILLGTGLIGLAARASRRYNLTEK